jgi:hypothetical protein
MSIVEFSVEISGLANTGSLTFDLGYKNDTPDVLNYASPDTISESVFGAEFLGQRIFDGNVPEVQDQVGYHHIRWPGGDFVELARNHDRDPNTPEEYIFSLTNPDYVNEEWVRGSGETREGITEMLEFAVENNLSFSLVAPTMRYVEMILTNNDGAMQAAADMEVFLTRLFSGKFGPVPDNFTIEVGSEYYNQGPWEEYTEDNTIDPTDVGPNGEPLAYVFGQVFAAMAAKIDDVQNNPPEEGWAYPIDVNVAVQGGRFHADSNDTQYGGDYEDNAQFIAAFDEFGQSALDAVDSVIWHRYVASSEWLGISDFISNPINHNEDGVPLTVSDLVADWEGAANNSQELDLLVGYAIPALDHNRHKLGHDEVSLTYYLQMTTELLAEGMDYASIFGFGAGQFGSLAFRNKAFIGGELWGLMAESLPGKYVVNGYQGNTGPVVNGEIVVDESVNSYVFEDDDQVVIFLVVKDFGAEGEVALDTLSYTLNLDENFSFAEATHLVVSGESHVENLNTLTGQMEPIGVYGEITSNSVNVINTQDASQFSVTFTQDYEVIRITLDKISSDTVGNDQLIAFVSSDPGGLYPDGTFNNMLEGGSGNDTLEGGSGNDTLEGGSGNDILGGSSGNDILGGGSGNDTLGGGSGNDTLRGGSGNDTFVFEDGNDVIEDFSLARGDRIEIEGAMIAAVAGMTGQQIVDTFASVMDGQVVFDFGVGDTLAIANLSALTGLADDVFVI